MQKSTSNIRKTVILGFLISLAIVLHIIEHSFPFFIVPWAKLGLPNIVVLFALIYYGLKEGLIISLARAVLGGFLSGLIFSPVFFLSFTGGIASTFAMWMTLPLLKRNFTLVTISIIGAFVHIVSQFAVVYLLLFENLHLTKAGIMATAPWFIIFALPAGIITGLAANSVIFYIKKNIPDIAIN